MPYTNLPWTDRSVEAFTADSAATSRPARKKPRKTAARTGQFLMATFLALLLSIAWFASGSVADSDDDDDDGENRPRRAGRIAETDGQFSGRYIQFSFDDTTCTVRDLRVHDVTIFDEIQLPGACKDARHDQHGASIRLRTDLARLDIHDAPNGLIRIEADAGNLTVSWPHDIKAAVISNQLELVAGKFTGTVRLHDNKPLDVHGDTVTVRDAKGSFWVHPIEGGSPERSEIRQHIRSGIIAGEIDILLEDGAVTSEILTYDAVEIRTAKHDDGQFRFIVDANLTEGRVFVVNLGPGVFSAANMGVRYWDVENGTDLETRIGLADGIDDVLTMSVAEGPEYWFVDDAAGRHVLVAVPHFSVHIVDILTFTTLAKPSIALGIVLGLAFVALGAVGVVPRRRPRDD